MSRTTDQNEDRRPLLFPTPRRISGFDADQHHDHTVVEIHDPTLTRQGYRIRVDGSGAVIAYADDAGLRYGRRTLDQCRDGSGLLPTIDVDDWPDFAERGFMLDISRDRVPTRQTLDRLVHVLEVCRFNHLQLYVEHTFAYRDHATVWGDASPLDGADLRWLRDRCASAGIELAANQNCFGHFERWLAHDRYRPMAECPDGFDLLPGVRFPPTTLAPTADNARFVVDLAREQIDSFGAGTVNIGCDETFELGHGVSMDRVRTDGRVATYVEHLGRIVRPLVDDGLTVQFWADVIAREPHLVESLPHGDIVALVWNYESPDTPLLDLPASITGPLAAAGIDLTEDTHFATRLAPFAESGIRHWVVPGTSTWNTLVGRLDNAFGNLVDAAFAGRDSGADGYMVTDWGDNGHQQPLTVSYPAIAYGGALAWGMDENAGADRQIADIIDRCLLRDEDRIIGGILERIGGVASRTGVIAQNASPLFAELIADALILTNGSPDAEMMRGVIDTLDDAAADLVRAHPTGPQVEVIIEELAVTIDLARFAARSMGVRAGLESPTGPAERVSELDQLVDRYRIAWLLTSRPGGLEDSVAHLQAARDTLRAAIAKSP